MPSTVTTIFARASLPSSIAVLVLLGVVGGGRAALALEDCRVVEDFAAATVGQFPSGWQVRKDAGKVVYAVREETGRKFLEASARDVGIQAAKEYAWDLGTHPILAWSWRPRQFPRDADERTARNDSVLAVYAVFQTSRISVKSLKYIWSEKVPVDTHLTGSFGSTQVRVVRSGTAGLNEWSEGHANVLEDYKRYFATTDVPKPNGIAVLTDADDTNSVAIGDYADFKVCRP